MSDYNDHPIEEVLANMDARIKQGWTCHVKFTCAHCGSRQTSGEPNSYAVSGYTCEECGGLTKPDKINFLAYKGLPNREGLEQAMKEIRGEADGKSKE